jgi:putative membrane protein
MMSATDIRGPVTYESSDHLAILFQMHGSVWLKVLPYCSVTFVLALIIKVAKSKFGINLTFNDQGHMFMSTMVSVLMVTRSRIAYSRYMSARALLSAVMRSCRELVQYLVTFTRYETTPAAIYWRGQVAACTVDLLFHLVDLLQMEDKGVLHKMQSSFHADQRRRKHGKNANKYDHGSFQHRNPLSMAIHLRSAIASHVQHLKRPLEANQELRLLSCTSDFVSANHGLVKLITTPFPFPLVQMTRTSLFVWVFTLPFALMSNRVGVFAYLLTFFLTYGFIGLELVSIELDDPFGNDANDINVMALVKVVLDDILVCLEDIDGSHAALSLQDSFASRFMVKDDVHKGNDVPPISPLQRLKILLSTVSRLKPTKGAENGEQICAAPDLLVIDNKNKNTIIDSTPQELLSLLPKTKLANTSQQQVEDEGTTYNYGCCDPQAQIDESMVSQAEDWVNKSMLQHPTHLSKSFSTIQEESLTLSPHDWPTTEEEQGLRLPVMSLAGVEGSSPLLSPTVVRKSNPPTCDVENIHPNVAKRQPQMYHKIAKSQAGNVLGHVKESKKK